MATVTDRSGNAPVSTDQKLSSANRTAANIAAVLALTPLYPGEIVRDLATGFQYMGSSTVAGAWVLCSQRATVGS